MSLSGEIKTIFTHLGRSPLEAETYIAALAIGSGTAAQIAQKTGEGRTKVYFHIKKLVLEGILKESRKGQRHIFIPIPPKELANIVTNWATNLQSLVPQLESLQKGAAETPMIEVTESNAGHRRIYEELESLPKDSCFRVIQGKKSLEEELRILDEASLKKFFDALISRNITTKGIFTKEALSIPKKEMSKRNYTGMQRRPSQISLIPEAILNLQNVMFIYANKVAFLFPELSLVMTITHQGIVDILKATFDALHHFGEKNNSAW